MSPTLHYLSNVVENITSVIMNSNQHAGKRLSWSSSPLWATQLKGFQILENRHSNASLVARRQLPHQPGW